MQTLSFSLLDPPKSTIWLIIGICTAAIFLLGAGVGIFCKLKCRPSSSTQTDGLELSQKNNTASRGHVN
jgi:hypothetical protein